MPVNCIETLPAPSPREKVRPSVRASVSAPLRAVSRTVNPAGGVGQVGDGDGVARGGGEDEGRVLRSRLRARQHPGRVGARDGDGGAARDAAAGRRDGLRAGQAGAA